MASGWRSIAFFLVVSVAIGFAAGYGILRFLGDKEWPWSFSMPWQQVETLLEAQSIASTAVEMQLDLGEGRIDATATLGVSQPGGNGDQVFLLLNPGLDVAGVMCNGAGVKWRRQAERLVVSLPEGTSSCELVIQYGGHLIAANSSPLQVTPDLLIADKLQWWYPLDLKSFGAFRASIQLPDGVELASSGVPLDSGDAVNVRTFQWEEARPVLGVGLAAGRMAKYTRLQGGIRCTVYTAEPDEDRVGEWLSALGDSYNYYATQLGADGYTQLNLVVSEEMDGIAQIGGPTLVAGIEALNESEEAFGAIAGRVAQNWWGDTVCGRWYSTRPEAGEWLVSGMSEYFGWKALKQVKGRRSYLRFMEQTSFESPASTPLKLLNLEERLSAGTPLDEESLRVRGAFAAAIIEAYVGSEAFMQAARNFMAVHRHTTVSYSALLHEMTLASEKPLEELVRLWFDRVESFDYGISNVAVEGGSAHVTIENVGNIPALVPLKLGVVTVDGYQEQSIDPGAQGRSVRFTVATLVKRVVLDPEFDLGDMRRANNVWPPTQWPLALDVSRNGRIALVADTEWGDARARRVFVFFLVDKAAGNVFAPPGGGPYGLQWDPDGQQLAIFGETSGVWRRDGWAPVNAGAVFLDWDGSAPVFWEGGKIGYRHDGGGQIEPSGQPLSVPLPSPRSGYASVRPETGSVAYVTDANVLVVWDPKTERLNPIRDNVNAVGGLRWRGDSNDLLYFDAGGTLFGVDGESGAEEVLLERNYDILHARLSQQGGRAAWIDPAGLLRAFTPGGGDAVYISLPGEVVDFAWEGEDAIIAIVAAVPRRLPMRFHAEYTLWRIPASTWTAVQLPYDPAQFAAASTD